MIELTTKSRNSSIDPKFVRSSQLRPQSRIKKAFEFQECREKGRKIFSKHLICQVCKNIYSYPRFGLIVTKKTGSAVVRNRWKRVIRDYFRNHRDQFHNSMDYVFVVKSSTKGKPLKDFTLELAELIGKIRVIA